MSASDSKSGEKIGLRRGGSPGQVDLSTLRAQFTSTPSPSLDQTLMQNSRFREEEKLRAKLRRESKLRREALSERISLMQDNMAADISRQHDLSLDAFENELRGQMEAELSKLESETLTREEIRLREMHEMRLEREITTLKEALEVEQSRKVEEHRVTVITQLESQLSDEHRNRLSFQRERLEIEFNQALQRKIRDLEATIQKEMEGRFHELESKEVQKLEEIQNQKLSEREESLRRGIRTRLEQQLKLRLKQREATMRAEYERRSLRLEEDVAASIQEELESRLSSETKEMEERMRQDIELAVARRREQLRAEVEKQLESKYSEKLSDRKSRLKEKYDLTFSKAVDDISKSLEAEIEVELESRMDQEFAAYRNAREAEIQNRLARFRYEREAELQDQMSDKYDSKKTDWSERLELEFKARESAARKAIMSEIDGKLRNERITHETDLDLLKEETVLELEAEMEERLAEFRARKEEEVASQLERQLDKREEIMRNKALIEVRKREANIRAEIEAQLGVKRSEIRDRLSSLTKQMDDFRTMAEVKMRESIESKVQGQIDTDEVRLAEQQQEFEELKSQDSRAEKRQSWLQAISGKGTQAQQPQMGIDPSALGARPSTLGSTAGRQPRGAMAQAAAQHTPSMGLAGMRAPRSTAKALSGAQPIARPVKAPIGGVMPLGGTPANLPQPIQPKVVRQPVVKSPVQTPSVVQSPVTTSPVVAPSVVKAPRIAAPVIKPTAQVEIPKPKLEIEQKPSEPVSEIAAVEVEPEVAIEEMVETVQDEVKKVQKMAVLKPITKLESVEVKTTVLKPIDNKVLSPVKVRGAPPSSAPGVKPGTQSEIEHMAILRPLTKLIPIELKDTDSTKEGK